MDPPRTGRMLAAYLADPAHRLVHVSMLKDHPSSFVALIEAVRDDGLIVRGVATNRRLVVPLPPKWDGRERRSAQERTQIAECLTFDARGFHTCGARVSYLDDADPFKAPEPPP